MHGSRYTGSIDSFCPVSLWPATAQKTVVDRPAIRDERQRTPTERKSERPGRRATEKESTPRTMMERNRRKKDHRAPVPGRKKGGPWDARLRSYHRRAIGERRHSRGFARFVLCTLEQINTGNRHRRSTGPSVGRGCACPLGCATMLARGTTRKTGGNGSRPCSAALLRVIQCTEHVRPRR